MVDDNFFHIIYPHQLLPALRKLEVTEEASLRKGGHIDLSPLEELFGIGNLGINVSERGLLIESYQQEKAWVLGYHTWAKRTPPEAREQLY